MIPSSRCANPPIASSRIAWLDYLRGLNIAATFLFHAFLAYSPFVQVNDLSFLPVPYVDASTALPVVDIILLLRPIFSMQLMFFLSGLFTWRSLSKRGALGYLRTRFLRLIIPLMVTTLLLMPLTYLPAFLDNRVSLGPLRMAHLWFLWVLFGFDLIAAFLFYCLRHQIEAIMQKLSNILIYLLASTFVIMVYLPLVNQSTDSGWIPLLGSQVFLLPRAWIGLYLFYFFLGVVLGSGRLKPNVISSNYLSPFAPASQHTLGITLFALVLLVFFSLARAFVGNLIPLFGSTPTWLFINSSYALAGFFIITSLILICKRYLWRKNVAFDNLASNSYGFYLVHYTFVVWCQFIFSRFSFAGVFKPIVVILFAFPLSWLVADVLRRVPMTRRFLVAG